MYVDPVAAGQTTPPASLKEGSHTFKKEVMSTLKAEHELVLVVQVVSQEVSVEDYWK